MSDLRELYQELILEHNKKPRNFHAMERPSAEAEGFNPLCGDRLKVYLKLKDGAIEDVSFEGSGCAISKASASLMTMSVKGKKIEDAHALFEKVHDLLSRDPGTPVNEEELGRLAVLSGVSEFPARVKCASLAWHTLKAGLDQKKKAVTTE